VVSVGDSGACASAVPIIEGFFEGTKRQAFAARDARRIKSERHQQGALAIKFDAGGLPSDFLEGFTLLVPSGVEGSPSRRVPAGGSLPRGVHRQTGGKMPVVLPGPPERDLRAAASSWTGQRTY